MGLARGSCKAEQNQDKQYRSHIAFLKRKPKVLITISYPQDN